MMILGRPLRLDVALVALYMVAGLPLQVWSSSVSPLPLMNYGLPFWPNLLVYGAAAPSVGYLLWRGSPRARFAAYSFLTFDIIRAARLAHWLPMVMDIAIILYLQTSAMRRLYPSMWERWQLWRRFGARR